VLTIDGATGEGGGQVLRTALALSLATGTAFRITDIRAGRKRPGLMRQHLTAVNAAAEVGSATAEGAALGSTELVFRPGRVAPGTYRFSVGTAGSTTLVLQTVLPALVLAEGPSRLVLEGGTHNPMAPPFEFLERAFLPLLGRMGATVVAELERPGFYPAGGGRFQVRVEPAPGKLERLDLLERGEILARRATAAVAHLPLEIAWRELRVVEQGLNWDRSCLRAQEVEHSAGPGNVLLLEIESEQVTEVFASFGQKGVQAEKVASEAVAEARAYLAAGVPVGRHLADQLLVPMALAGGGSFRTLPLSRHATTQIELVEKFLPVEVTSVAVQERVCQVEVRG
jgi:RNA 3'-terminal phosphate cyclase (ATP)